MFALPSTSTLIHWVTQISSYISLILWEWPRATEVTSRNVDIRQNQTEAGVGWRGVEEVEEVEEVEGGDDRNFKVTRLWPYIHRDNH